MFRPVSQYVDNWLIDWAVAADIATVVAAVAGVLAVIFVLWQIDQQKALARATFENLFAQEYFKLLDRLPLDALLGKDLSKRRHLEAMSDFYRYVDLCNKQAFHHRMGQISEKTWSEWREGIQSNLRRPAFKRAWDEIAAQTPSSEFEELRRLCPPDPIDIV